GITPERRLREIEHSGVKEQAGLLLIFTCSGARSVIRMISSPCSRRSAPMEQRYACGCRRGDCPHETGATRTARRSLAAAGAQASLYTDAIKSARGGTAGTAAMLLQKHLKFCQSGVASATRVAKPRTGTLPRDRWERRTNR